MHKCECDPTKEYMWTKSQLQAWYEAHDGWIRRLGKVWTVVHNRVGNMWHVRFVEYGQPHPPS